MNAAPAAVDTGISGIYLMIAIHQSYRRCAHCGEFMNVQFVDHYEAEEGMITIYLHADGSCHEHFAHGHRVVNERRINRG